MWKHLTRSTVALILGLGLVSTGKSAHGDSWRVTVRGGEVQLPESPTIADLNVPVPVGIYQTHSESAKGSIAAQVFEENGMRRLAVLLPRLAAHRDLTITLAGPLQVNGGDGPGLWFRTEENKLKVMLDRQLFTEYQLGVGHKPFFFPLIGPTGEPFTRAYPMLNVEGEDHDHPHQRSCWFTHGKVNGVDFWSEGKQAGTIRETGRKLIATGPVVARFTTTNEWRSPDDRKICVDERTMTFYDTESTRVVDFDFRVSASEGPLTFGDTKEGMFGLRVASTMDVTRKEGGRIRNAEGLVDDKAWGKASPWVDYVGPVKDKLVGIAIINHPVSFRYPTTWHVRTYGLFAANPFGWHDFGRTEHGDYTIPNGQSVKFSYRVILHEGDTHSANVPRMAAAYIKPPVLDVHKD
jgi:hypothetical protein